MMAALIILGALIVVGGTLWLLDRSHKGRSAESDATVEGGETTEPSSPQAESDDGCCGMHITCERDSLLTAMQSAPEYYDDEELDAYAGRAADSYADDEIEQFRDVLLTLRPDDIAPWARSIQMRGIELPEAVREELLLIVAEARAAR